jgi:hypothetical protein
VIGVFVVSILLVVGFVITSMPVSNRETQSYVSIIKNKIAQYLPNISINVNSNILLIIIASFTVIVLISFYFVLEEHKSFKQKLDSIL